MNVRLARPTDARAIACVHVASWQTTYPGIMPDDVLANLSVEARERYWAHVLGDPRGQHIVYVAEDDAGKIVGFASGGPERTGDSVYQGELYAIYLLATRQRKGLGGASSGASPRGLPSWAFVHCSSGCSTLSRRARSTSAWAAITSASSQSPSEARRCAKSPTAGRTSRYC